MNRNPLQQENQTKIERQTPNSEKSRKYKTEKPKGKIKESK